MEGQARILVLEDDPNMREVLRGTLEDEGHEVTAVGRGEEAVALAGRSTFDLVILDIRMEGLDGLEALGRMQPHLEGAGSLVITGYASEADPIRALRLGVGDYLRKPFERHDLLERVTRLLARTREERLRRARDEQLRALGPWGAEAVTRSLEGRTLPPRGAERLIEAGQLAARLASSLGMDSPEREQIRVTTLLIGLHRRHGAALPDPEEAGAPPLLEEALGGAPQTGLAREGPRGPYGAALPLPARIAELALAATGDGAAPADPLLERALGEAGPGPLEPNPGAAARGRGLLALGRALLDAGDSANARESFRQALASGSTSLQVEALLSLAEEASRGGRRGEVERCLEQALALARPTGPASAARTALAGGLLGRRAGLPLAAGLLSEAVELLEQLGLEPELSRARLALACLDPSAPLDPALVTLLAPEHAQELTAAAPWLLPLLLGSSSSPAVDRALQRLLREATGALASLLEQDALPAQARLRAAALFAAAPSLAPQGLLARLSGDPDPALRRLASQGLSRPTSSSPPPILRIHALGPLEAWLGEARLEERSWRAQRVKFLFAYLAAQEGRPVTEDRLLETFWPDDPERGKSGLYWALSTLRRCLRGWGPDPVPRARGLVGLNPALSRWHDAEELERAATSARAARSEPGRALAGWHRVASLYRGPYLEGCYMDWALNQRQRLESWVQEALAALHQGWQERGLPGEALECARRWLEIDPLSQTAARRAMESLTALGRGEEALRLYERCRRLLARELDLEPSIELLEAYHRARLTIL